MCTAVTYKTKDTYFGRNLDLEYSYQETVTIAPRNYVFHFRKLGKMQSHYAIIGMAYICKNYPLYYDAMNEKGLCIAGLNFPDNADYNPFEEGKDNVTPFELIPWILGQCATVEDVKNLIAKMNLLNENFSAELPLSPLHWMISDKERSVTLESVKTGIKVYENPVGVLTNNPTFDFQLLNLSNYMNLTNEDPQNLFVGKNFNFRSNTYSRGMGALGLPGDFSSMSRFVKASFVKANSLSGITEEEGVTQFFHILKSVEMPRGCVQVSKDDYEFTRYSSCCNTDRGIYYYTTYENSQICAVDMFKENLEGHELISYPLQTKPIIIYQN